MAGYKVVLYDEVLYLKGHDARNWFDRVSRALDKNVRESAPVNSGTKNPKSAKNPYGGVPAGTLKARISTSATHLNGPRSMSFSVKSGAPYSTFVIKGVPAIIRPTTGPFLILPKNGHKGTRKRYVRGQTGYDFFLKGARKTAVTHSSLRGYHPT